MDVYILIDTTTYYTYPGVVISGTIPELNRPIISNILILICNITCPLILSIQSIKCIHQYNPIIIENISINTIGWVLAQIKRHVYRLQNVNQM